LVETGTVEVRRDAEGEVYRSGKSTLAAELPRLRALAAQVDAGNIATLDLLDHAAGIYTVVARSGKTGEQCMFGPQGIALWLNYFHNGNLTYAVNNWVGAVVSADRLEKRPTLRVLEIGAGAGSATGTLLNWFEQTGLLPRVERYLVTEPNAFFRRRAQRELTTRFPKVPLEWSTLDLDLPWLAQIAGSGKFDLIYAVNVLHVAKDLGFSLNEATSALADGGWLVIGECVRPYENQPIYPELMFQNLESFIDVTTDPDIRPRPGFLTPEQWRRAFGRSGLSRIEIAPDVEKIRDIYPHFFTAAICGQKVGAGDDSTGARA
jgi:SAM-dependent methyltransferase